MQAHVAIRSVVLYLMTACICQGWTCRSEVVPVLTGYALMCTWIHPLWYLESNNGVMIHVSVAVDTDGIMLFQPRLCLNYCKIFVGNYYFSSILPQNYSWFSNDSTQKIFEFSLKL